MNQELNKRKNDKEANNFIDNILNQKDLILKIKYFLSIIKIQRVFRKYKSKIANNVIYDHQLARTVNYIYSK